MVCRRFGYRLATGELQTVELLKCNTLCDQVLTVQEGDEDEWPGDCKVVGHPPVLVDTWLCRLSESLYP